MSYAFKITQEASLAPNFSEVDVRDNTFDLPQNTYVFERDDVVHITYQDGNFIKGFYAVCTGTGANAGFEFDQDVYPVTTTINQSDVLGCDVYRGDAYTKISDINISVEVDRAVYSEQYKAYNVSKKFTALVNAERRRFFSAYNDVAYANKIILVDYCENYAYGVSFDKETFALLNNKFSKALAFNVATR